jgi:hypothetical protein
MLKNLIRLEKRKKNDIFSLMEAKMSEIRKSPAYPRIDLDRAVDLARKVYESIYDGEVDSQTIPSLMGFGGPSGASAAAVGSLKQYGLLEGRGEKLKISELAKAIILPISDDDRNQSLLRAADAPPIYRAIRSDFGGKLPADQVIKAMLVRKFGFSSAGAEGLIRVLRETDSLTQKFRGESYTRQTELDRQIDIVGADSSEVSAIRAQAGELKADLRPNDVRAETARASFDPEVLNFRISKDSTVRIQFDGPVSVQAIDRLIKLLEITRDNYD